MGLYQDPCSRPLLKAPCSNIPACRLLSTNIPIALRFSNQTKISDEILIVMAWVIRVWPYCIRDLEIRAELLGHFVHVQ